MIKVDSKLNIRRVKALQRLEAQIKSGVKPLKLDGKTTNKTENLNEKDLKKIESQIATLKERIVKS